MSPLPTISKAYGILLQEEQQKELHSIRNHVSESTIFTARRFTENKPYYNAGSGSQASNGGNQSRNFTYTRNNMLCEHCMMKNHTIDKCWKLHGYPKDFKGKGKRVAAVAHLEEHADNEVPSGDSGTIHASFTEDQYSQFMKYLNIQKASSQVEHQGSSSLGLATSSHMRGPFQEQAYSAW
ncbi:uncharacterized protein [Spinacia oleracea]|uniref:Uncharacterized protein n=1 Tax=Spinacia oleracea TaxID=3562 RepID=A0ABM3RST1_SPIOL|nr:uncharacterized protein LOC130472192 [Spinacia oleracea]